MSDNSYGTTFGPSAPGAINLVSGDTGNVDMTHTDPTGVDLDRHRPRRRRHARRPRRLLADQRRPAVLGRLLDPRRRRAERQEHRRRAQRGRPLVGLVRGRLPADRELRRGDRRHRSRGQSTATFIPDEFKNAGFQTNRAALDEPGPVRRGAPDRHRVRRHARHRAVGLQGRLHPAPRAVPVLRVDGQPAPPDVPTDGSGNDTLAGLGTIGTDTQSYVGRRAAVQHAEPQLRHERLRPARRGDHSGPAARVGAAGRHLPQGAGLPGRARRSTRTRPTSRRSS